MDRSIYRSDISSRTVYGRYIGSDVIEATSVASVRFPTPTTRLVHFRTCAQHPGSFSWPARLAGSRLRSLPCAATSTTHSPGGRCSATCAPASAARLDVCDAQPELLRAARQPRATGRRRLPRVRRRRASCSSRTSTATACATRTGAASRPREELAELEATREEFSRYVVEVCVECHWNHLQRHELHGRRHAA